MNKKRKHLPSVSSVPPDFIPDDANLDTFNPQADSDPELQGHLGKPGLDVYGQADSTVLPARRTRSGRAYSVNLKPIMVYPRAAIAQPDLPHALATGDFTLKSTSLPETPPQVVPIVATPEENIPVCRAHSSSSELPGQDPSNLASVPSEPQSGPCTRSKKVTFDPYRDVRVFTPSSTVYEYSDLTQIEEQVEKHKSTLIPVLYFMPQCLGLDHSFKEIFYKSSFTTPLANTLALEDEIDDFYY